MKCVYFLLFVLLTSVLPLTAQLNTCEGEGAWLPVGEGLPARVHASVVMDGELYVVYRQATSGDYIIDKWTGTTWQRVVDFSAGGMSNSIYAMAFYNEELYISGRFSHVNNVPGTALIAKWNGSEWESVGGGGVGNDTNTIPAMAVYKGRLVAAGRFTTIGSIEATGIAAWNGVQWEAVTVEFPNMEKGHRLTRGLSLLVYHDVLYVNGDLNIDGETIRGTIVVWNGETWQEYRRSPGSYASAMAVYNDTLYVAHSFAGVEKWAGEWVMVSPRKEIGEYLNMTVYNGSLYVAGYVMLWGPDFENANVVRYDGSKWHKVAVLNQPAVFLRVINDELYAGGFFTTSCETRLNYVARFCNDKTCGNISGRVFHDTDNNCEQSDTENNITNRIVQLQPGGYYARTDNNGRYNFFVPPGLYTVSVSQRDYWQQTCPASGTYSVEISEPAQHATGNDFGFTATEEISLLEVSIAGSPARPGREVSYTIHYENVGTLPFTGTIRMTYDPALVYQSSMPTPYTHSGNLITWKINDLAIGARGTIEVVFALPPDASLVGETICVDVQAMPAVYDELNEIEGYDKECTEITGSYDPNMIVVSPRGSIPDGFISTTDTVLQYVVHFQNTGNDTAFKVVVFDKIPEQLDLLTLRPGASSHAYEMDITDKGELRWVFRDIMLPDSTASEPSSHGYVKYEIKLKKNLPLGTEIRNSADIYFDYNEPVRTNEVKNVIHDLSTGVGNEEYFSGAIYPNPANDRVTIASTSLVAGEIVVYNNLGEAVLVVHHAGGAQVNLSIYSLAPGVYYVSYPIAGGALGRALTIVR